MKDHVRNSFDSEISILRGKSKDITNVRYLRRTVFILVPYKGNNMEAQQ